MDLTDSEFEKLLHDTLSSNEEPSEFLKAKLNSKLDEKIKNNKTSKIFDINSLRGLKTAAAAAIVVVTTIGIVTNSDNPVILTKTPVVANNAKIISEISVEDDKQMLSDKENSDKSIKDNKQNEKPDDNQSTKRTQITGEPVIANVESDVLVASQIDEEDICVGAYTPPEEIQVSAGGNGRSLPIVHDNEESMDKTSLEISFNIETEAKEVTKKGLTLVINHNSDEFESEVSTGAEFYLESFVNDEWSSLKTNDEIFWNMIAYTIPSGTEHKVNWENLYGELSNGKYRLIKRFSLTSKENVSDEYVTVTEFEINE